MEEQMVVTTDEALGFGGIIEVCNRVFGSGYTGTRAFWAYFTPRAFKGTPYEGWKAWFPHFDEDGVAACKKWLNELSSDGRVITETYLGEDERVWRPSDYCVRVAFGRFRDPGTGEVFYRFIGVLAPLSQSGRTAVYGRVATRFSLDEAPALLEVGIPEAVGGFEGGRREVVQSVYERDPENRRRCIEAHGLACVVCGLDFEEAYGELGKGFIHVHHLTPVASMGRRRRVDPVRDLVPVCPNCHAMLHRVSPPMRPEELREIYERCRT